MPFDANRGLLYIPKTPFALTSIDAFLREIPIPSCCEVGCGNWVPICFYLPPFATIRTYDSLFVICDHSPFAIVIRYSGFPDTHVLIVDSCEPKAERTFCSCTNLKFEMSVHFKEFSSNSACRDEIIIVSLLSAKSFKQVNDSF